MATEGLSRGNHPVRWAGVAAVATLWLTVIVGMMWTGLGVLDERAISYLGTDSRSVGLFRTGLTVAALAMAAFAWFVGRNLSTRASFLTVFLVGLGGQLIAAFVSIAGRGLAHGVHVAGGLILGGSLPALMWRFAAGQPPGRRRQNAYALFWLEVAACLVGFGLSKVGQAPLAEIVPAFVFHVWVVTATVWSASTAGTPTLQKSL